jgi:hypothetical protein
MALGNYSALLFGGGGGGGDGLSTPIIFINVSHLFRVPAAAAAASPAGK